jgi:hypothetical protein
MIVKFRINTEIKYYSLSYISKMLINFLLLICLICGSNPQEFCSEVHSIDGIFNYNDIIFVLKRNQSLITIYRYKSSSSLKGNNGFTVKTYFKTGEKYFRHQK